MESNFTYESLFSETRRWTTSRGLEKDGVATSGKSETSKIEDGTTVVHIDE